MTLRINDNCIACGLCPAMCPRAFQMNAAGDRAEVIDPAAEGADVAEAQETCPTQAIERE